MCHNPDSLHEICEEEINVVDSVHLAHEAGHVLHEHLRAVVVQQVHIDTVFPHHNECLLERQPDSRKHHTQTYVSLLNLVAICR